MNGRRLVYPRYGRRAVTLLEVLLTLGLLVIITALVWPVLQRPLANQRLRKAADRVRAGLVSARVEAIDSGETHAFQYAVGGRSFRIRQQAAEFMLAAGDGAADALDDVAAADVSAGQYDQSTDGSLPEGVTFAGDESAADMQIAIVDSPVYSSEFDEGAWSAPILFHPDGTTSNVKIVLQNEYGRRIRLSLRALTGVVTLGEVAAGEE